MIRKLTIAALLVATGCLSTTANLSAQEMAEWQVNADYGFPAFVAANWLDGRPPDNRKIYIYLESADFTPENLKALFAGLAADFPQPEGLEVTVFSDRVMLRRAMSINSSDSTVGWADMGELRKGDRQWAEKYRPLPTGYYRARYFRARADNHGEPYTHEQYAYSPDPDKEEMVNVRLRGKPAPPYSGDLNADLLIAVEEGDTSKVKLLLAEGADANTRDYAGDTVLLIATRSATDDGTVKALLDAGADVNAENYGYRYLTNRQMASIYAAGHKGPEILKALLDGGARVNAQNGNKCSALLMAAANGRVENVKMLLAKGAETELRDEEGKTALLWAAERGHREIVKELLARHAKVDVVDNYGWTALMLASDKEVVMQLLEQRADVNVRDKDGATAIFYAIENKNLDKVKVLIEAGADVNVKDKDGDTPLMRAQQQYEPERLIQLLKHAGAKE